MNIIFVSYDLSKDSRRFYHMANTSNFFAQKNKYKTILYCDEQNFDLLKNIPYNEIKILPSKIMNEIPRGLWSMAKIVALSDIEEPSIVIDLDLFLFKKLDKKKLDTDIIYLHDEPYSPNFVDPLLEWCKEVIFPEVKHLNSNLSHNCGIIGGQNYKAIKSVAKEIIELVIQNNKKWDELSKQESKNIFLKKYYPLDENALFIPIVLIEQIWMFDLFKLYDKNIKIKPYFNNASEYLVDSFAEGIYHIWGQKDEKFLNIISKFSEKELDYNKEYKNFNYDTPFLKKYEAMLNTTKEKLNI